MGVELLDNVRLEQNRKITLPDAVLNHYRLTQDTPIRVVETSNGILLIPLTDEPMDDELKAELAMWQSAGAKTWQMFPFDDERAQPCAIIKRE